jgi:GNAT superfamily N-acetyltransferase
MSQVQEQISDIDRVPILFVYSIYIRSFARGRGISNKYLSFLCERYQKRIECECWYDIPANVLYLQNGFRPIVTRYMLPLNK